MSDDWSVLKNLPWHFSQNDHPILFHYTTEECARLIATNQSLWLSEYTVMNDSSEFFYARDRLMEALLKTPMGADSIVKFALIHVINNFSQQVSVVLGSLSVDSDSLGQWRNYAANGSGCVLGVRASFLCDEAGLNVRKVVYDEKIIDTILEVAVDVIFQQYKEDPEDIETLVEYARHAAADLFCIKHPCFLDEREVRVSRMLARDEHGVLFDPGGHASDGADTLPLAVLDRETKFGTAKYISLPLGNADGGNAIVEVGLGPTMSDQAKTSCRLFFEAQGFRVWDSKLPYRC
ncbi:DUF2971 domain-containing protein [Blastomonas fulva]|jgi:hypothetical protein|uniref:DUF2971 domain-containing protein n=1 Tax=Blastomonas fulva TaxID=1550728 RepID=UPI0025A4B4A1|nr:DUF2971 domain-containing protein [Blastomonas fulva]MDM7929053.1 DUF2971 domain-containing protein [Blastomonas fulva]MDM7967309.1 DUF2971 domain-containing protein [Blastomonas fulva]